MLERPQCDAETTVSGSDKGSACSGSLVMSRGSWISNSTSEVRNSECTKMRHFDIKLWGWHKGNIPPTFTHLFGACPLFAARCHASAAYAFCDVRLCVSPPIGYVTFVNYVKTNKHIFEFFSPSGRLVTCIILVFPYQTHVNIPTGTPERGRRT